MRSDRDKRTETEREIDEFLSKFENPSDELSADYSSYLNEKNTTKMTAAQTFHWKSVDSTDLSKAQSGSKSKGSPAPEKKEDAPAPAEKPAAVENTDKKAEAVTEKKAGAETGSQPVKQTGKKKKKKKKVPKEATAAAAYAATEPAVSAVTGAAAAASVATETAAAVSKPKKAPAVSIVSKETAVFKPDDEKTIVKDRSSKKGSGKAKKHEEPRKITKDTTPSAAASGVKEVPAAPFFPEKKKEVVRPTPNAKQKQPKQKQPKQKQPGTKDKAPAAAAKASKSGKSQKSKKAGSKEKGNLKQKLFYKKNKSYDPSKGATYVVDGKTIKNKEFKFSFLKLIRDMVALGFIFVLAGVIYAMAIIAVAPKYDYKDIYSAIDTASVIYDDQNNPIDNVFYTENRKVIKYEDMPQDLINSFVAIEDKTFWKHHGFNWTRMIGAILSSLTGSGRISGTSTITQQLARNVYLADTKSERSIKRKLLEMYYASRIEHSLDKEEIVEAYLNTIYLGHGCYGVNAAAQTYFSKNVKDLSLVECASLAALPQEPDTYALLKLATEAQNVVDSKVVATEPDTVVTNDCSRDRRQLVLDLMLDQKYITQEDHDAVYEMALNDFINPNLKSSSSIYSYFHEYVVDTVINDLVEQYDMTKEDAERMVYTKGLQIYSTVDSQAMEVIAKEFQDDSNFPYVTAPKDADGNMLNNDGKIALYKYDNYFDDDGNFRLSSAEGDVRVNSDGSFTIIKDHKLYIYQTEVNGATDYSIEFKKYYFYDDSDTLYSIAGGYLNIPADYKSMDEDGNIIIDKSFFDDPYYDGVIKIDGKDVIITERAYTLSPKQRQPQAAMTIVGVGTGEVKAMVGGRQFGGQKVLNRSLNARQPGSSIKPLAVYGAALQKSYELAAAGKKWKFTNFHIDKQGTKGWGDYVTVHSSIEDEKCKIEGKYWPNNFNNSFSGKNTFKTAIQKSINTCAVKLVLQVGCDYSIEQLKKFGLTTVQDDLSDPVNDSNPAALGLGAMTEGVKPLEMALAYASFPGGGKVNTPICYYKVLDRDGNVLLEGKSEQSEALNEGVAWIMTDVLKSVVKANGYMHVSSFVPGGKTGTTNDQYDIWFDGFSPTYAASIWIGTDENVEMSSMSTPAAALWGKIMDQIPNASKGKYAEMPSNVIQKGGEYFTKGTETGLDSWSNKEAKEKAKKEAYEKWLKERENHKHKVIDVEEHDEPVYEVQKVKVKDAWTEYPDPIEHPAVEDDPNTEENEAKEAWTEYPDPIEHPAEYEEKKVKVGTKHIKEQWHWEYDEGWRDGDFKYKEDD